VDDIAVVMTFNKKRQLPVSYTASSATTHINRKLF